MIIIRILLNTTIIVNSIYIIIIIIIFIHSIYQTHIYRIYDPSFHGPWWDQIAGAKRSCWMGCWGLLG